MTDPTDPSYTAQALRTESPITPALQTRLRDTPRLVHAVLGLLTEAGELADPIKKHIFYGRPVDAINLREEIGDCLWYLAIAADALGTTLEAEQARNLAKLRARYPHVFTAEAAQVRDLDRERQVLEGNDLGTLVQQSQRAVSDAFSEINFLRQQLDAARALIRDTRQQRDETVDKLNAANSRLVQLSEELQTANENNRKLMKQRDAAQVTILAQRTGIELQRRVVDKVRQMLFKPNRDIEYGDINGLRAALAELDASTEPTPVAEPTPCPECERLQLAMNDSDERITNLVQFVEKVRPLVNVPRRPLYPSDIDFVRAALAKLDASTEPTPVAEPAPCPECERLRAELEKANKHCIDLVLFVDKVRKSFRVWGGDQSFFDFVSHALDELDTNPSATLTSSVVKESLTPTPVAEPLDAEGGK